MAKANDKVHEYRMSGAAWLLEIIKREGIEEAEKELEKKEAEIKENEEFLDSEYAELKKLHHWEFV